jgi:hypothetical protein
VAANDKLLKALIGLLAIKDDHLLGELRTIFAMAEAPGAAANATETRTWDQVRRGLELITDMVEGEDGEGAVGRTAHN